MYRIVTFMNLPTDTQKRMEVNRLRRKQGEEMRKQKRFSMESNLSKYGSAAKSGKAALSKKKWWRRNRVWVAALVFIATSATLWM